MKRLLPTLVALAISTLVGTAQAYTAVAFSSSTNKFGGAKNAITKAEAMTEAVANCKRNSGGDDCQVFKVSDKTGFSSIHMACAGGGCGVTATTGRATQEEAHTLAKQDCEKQFGVKCKPVAEWEEKIGSGKADTPSVVAKPEKAEAKNTNEATPQREPNNAEQVGQTKTVLPGEKYSLIVNKPPFTTGPIGFANSRKTTVNSGRNDVFAGSSTRFIARFPHYGSGVSYFITMKDSVKTNGVIVTSAADLAKELIENSGFKFSEATKLDVQQPTIPGAEAIGYFSRGIPYNNEMHGMKAVYVYSVILPGKRTAYALMTSLLTPIDNEILKKGNFNFDPKNITNAYDAAFMDIMSIMDDRKDKNKDFQINDDGIAEAAVYGKGVKYWEKKFSDSIIYQRTGAVACQDGSFPKKREISDALPFLVCRTYLSYGKGWENVIVKSSEAEEYIQLIDPKQNLSRSQEALDFLSGSDKTQIKNDLVQSVELAGAAMKWLMKNVELRQTQNSGTKLRNY